jgi:hypothetical protein
LPDKFILLNKRTIKVKAHLKRVQDGTFLTAQSKPKQDKSSTSLLKNLWAKSLFKV